MTERAASGPAADPERGRQRHRRCCLQQHDWADRHSDCNNHRAERLKRNDGILRLSASAIAAGRTRNAWVDTQAILGSTPLAGTPDTLIQKPALVGSLGS